MVTLRQQAGTIAARFAALERQTHALRDEQRQEARRIISIIKAPGEPFSAAEIFGWPVLVAQLADARIRSPHQLGKVLQVSPDVLRIGRDADGIIWALV